MKIKQLAAGTALFTAALTACETGRDPQPNHPTAVESLAPTLEQTPDTLQLVKQVGFIAVDARGGGQAGADQLNAERFPVAQKAANNLENATNHKIDFKLVNEGSYAISPASTDIAALKNAQLPSEQRTAIEEKLVEQAMEAAQDRGIDFSDNDITVVSLEVPTSSDEVTARAQGEANGFEASTPAGIVAAEVNPQESGNVTDKTSMHEIVHALNEGREAKVLHSNTANCDGFLELPGKSDKLPLTMTDAIAQGCNSVEYGDKTTIMGGAELKSIDKDPLNAFQLLQLGALSPEQVKSISKPGNYELELNALRNSTETGTKLIRIDLPDGVKVPLNEVDHSLHYAYLVELSNNASGGLGLKLIIAGFNDAGEPVGSTFAIPLNSVDNAGDPSLVTKHRDVFYKDERFDLSLSVDKLTVTDSQAHGSAKLSISRSQ